MDKRQVVIPAHNKEKYVARCIKSVKTAAEYYGSTVEIIVVCNRCTDRTADIAQKYGAKLILNKDRCIAKARNIVFFAKMYLSIQQENTMTWGIGSILG